MPRLRRQNKSCLFARNTPLTKGCCTHCKTAWIHASFHRQVASERQIRARKSIVDTVLRQPQCRWGAMADSYRWFEAMSRCQESTNCVVVTLCEICERIPCLWRGLREREPFEHLGSIFGSPALLQHIR